MPENIFLSGLYTFGWLEGQRVHVDWNAVLYFSWLPKFAAGLSSAQACLTFPPI